MRYESPGQDLAHPSFADPEIDRIVVLADDLTGACDASAAFLQSARAVRVWFGNSVLFSVPETVQAFNTNSRALSPNRAAAIVSRTTQTLASDPSTLFFKKVDSAGRGPIGAEILAAHRALSTRAILFAPAFPAAGRMVRDGVLEVQNSTGEVQQISLVSLFPPDLHSRIGLVSSASELIPMLRSGKTILVCDSGTQDDLDALARIADYVPGLLYVGSAGLAQALSSLRSVSPPSALVPPSERVLIITGSPHPVTKLQLEMLDRNRFRGLRVIRLHSTFAARTRIRSAFRASKPQALILAGGETALFAVLALEAHSFILQGELSPGIPWGLIQGGLAHGCVVVTKSGGFGGPKTLNYILAALQGST
jgi:D-threonate/D-erythronate kinase